VNYRALALTLLLACGKEAAPAKQGGPQQIAEVGVVEIVATPVTLSRELPGRLTPFRVAEVRARVNGIVQKRLFTEGSDVKANQPLFKIDPEPYVATLESARAQLLRAEATVESAKSQAERFAKLVETNAVSRQEYEDAQAKLKTTTADVAAARAAVKAAQINVGFTTVEAPIAGRIGRSDVTEGAYGQQSSATLMATIQQLDPVYVDMTWSATEMMRLRHSIESGELQTATSGSAGAPTGERKAKVAVILEDGRTYDQPGLLQFTDVSVDQSTGSVTLRALVPNPKGELLPGMFVRARIDEGTMPNALLVPQRAVTRDQNARPVAMVVGADGKVERRLLETDRAIGDAWVVTNGIKAGEKVIVEGLQKARPGATVKTVPAGQATAGGGSAGPLAAAGSAGSGSGATPQGSGSGSGSPFAPMSAAPAPRAGQ